MGDLPVHNFLIKSHVGEYTVEFNNNLLGSAELANLGTHYIVDANVFDMCGPINSKNIVIIDANETTKSYQGIEPIIEKLLVQGLKRDSVLVAIGGGITQDITCFIATTFMRGIRWKFVPTTLLAQADSCIGSKSSINFGHTKNLLGSFTPPEQVIISEQWLKTLEDKDIASGIGEIIKLYLIDGHLIDSEIIRMDLSYHVYQTLKIKQRFIEEDEFDKNIRNILNYGHCFGHGIESATNFSIPHGIAVTMGMDVANRFALTEKLISRRQFEEMQNILYPNYKQFADVYVDVDQVLTALTKDKKNTTGKINIVIPSSTTFVKMGFDNTDEFWQQARQAVRDTPFRTDLV